MDPHANGTSCLEPDIGAQFVPALPENPRPKIVALCKHCTNRLLGKADLMPYEYWAFDAVTTDEMADVLLKLKVRKPYTLAAAVKATGVKAAQLEPLLDEMSWIGLLEYNWENPTRTKQWVLPMLVPGTAEFLNMRQSQIDEHPAVAKFFEQASKVPLSRATPMVPPGGAGIGMHVIPVERAIEAVGHSASVEHIEHWLDKYEGKYAASPCSCRMSREKLGEGCGDDAQDWCIAVGDMADYVVETDRGRYITRDEVHDILQQAEDNGFVHQITNIDGQDKIFAICNCNVDVCYALRTSQLFNTPNLSRSAYVAHVDAQACTACGGCVEVCPAGAAKLGQKLCGKDGPIEYPKQELPDATSWGPEKWAPGYRDKNRVETHEAGTAPCKTACPAHIAVQGYLKLAAQGKYTEALALIKKENPLPAVCGRICNRRCEDACTRGRVDEAVAIDEVKKFIAQRDLRAETRYIPPRTVPSTQGALKEKIAIVGAGPAGLTCAYYLAEKGYEPVVFEKRERAGGMLTYGVPAYKLSHDVIQAEVDVIAVMGVQFRFGVDVGRDVTLDDLREQGFSAFYLAVGCQDGLMPDVEGVSAPGVYSAAEFLRGVAQAQAGEENTPAWAVEAAEAGVRACERGAAVVVGGGNVAVDVARTCARLGYAPVTMVSLEAQGSLPASDEELAGAAADGVANVYGFGVARIVAPQGKAESVVLKRCVGVTDESGAFAPQYDEGETVEIAACAVVFAVGQKTDWADMLNGSAVGLNANGAAAADAATYQTAQPDVFVGGDAFTGPSFAIDAIAAGHEAAVSLHRFVRGASLTIGRNPRAYRELDVEGARIESYDTAARQQPVGQGAREGNLFAEYEGTFTESQVKAETARCLGCGASIVDANKCIGCGLCTTKCAFDAIRLQRDIPEASRMVRSEKKIGALLPYAAKRAIKIKFAKKRG